MPLPDTNQTDQNFAQKVFGFGTDLATGLVSDAKDYVTGYPGRVANAKAPRYKGEPKALEVTGDMLTKAQAAVQPVADFTGGIAKAPAAAAGAVGAAAPDLFAVGRKAVDGIFANPTMKYLRSLDKQYPGISQAYSKSAEKWKSHAMSGSIDPDEIYDRVRGDMHKHVMYHLLGEGPERAAQQATRDAAGKAKLDKVRDEMKARRDERRARREQDRADPAGAKVRSDERIKEIKSQRAVQKKHFPPEADRELPDIPEGMQPNVARMSKTGTSFRSGSTMNQGFAESGQQGAMLSDAERVDPYGTIEGFPYETVTSPRNLRNSMNAAAPIAAGGAAAAASKRKKKRDAESGGA